MVLLENARGHAQESKNLFLETRSFRPEKAYNFVKNWSKFTEFLRENQKVPIRASHLTNRP